MNIPEHIEHGMNNLLNIEDAGSIWCRVLQMYTTDVFTGLSLSIARKSTLKADAFVSFNNIQYFDGPLLWQGANIRTASKEECDFFISNSNLRSRNLSGYYLYEIQTQGSVVHIIALNIFFEENRFEYEERRDDELIKKVTIQERSGEPIVLKYREYNNKSVPYASSSVEQVLRMFQEGRRYEEILHMMPWLEPEDIQACLAYARKKLK